MTKETHSSNILRNSLVDFVDSTDDSIELPDKAIVFGYGVVTPCRMGDYRTQIGDTELTYEEVDEIVAQLSERTGKHYFHSIICTERGDEEYKAIMFIGRDVPALMTSLPYSADSLVRSQKLETVVTEGDQIIEDLKSIGFKDITKEDLFLHAG